MSADEDKTSGEDKSPPAEHKSPTAAAATKDKPAENEREGGLWPAILVGVGLLAVVGLLVFGGGDDEPSGKGKPVAGGKGAQAGAEAGAAGAPGERGGVAARPTDKPTTGTPTSSRLNPAVKMPAVGMAPQGGEETRKDEEPPEGATREELIAWHEKKLEEAKKHLVQRKIFMDRLPQIRERIETSNRPDKDKELEQFEGRAKIVEDNLAKAQQKVDDLEKKLAQIKGE